MRERMASRSEVIVTFTINRLLIRQELVIAVLIESVTRARNDFAVGFQSITKRQTLTTDDDKVQETGDFRPK
jgi:hypothetical protein